MYDGAIVRGLAAFRCRRDAAWSFMVAAAERKHTDHRPLTAEKMQRRFDRRTYGISLRDMAIMFGLKTKTIHTLHRILAHLITEAEKNGSTHAEVFERFGGSFALAEKRTRHAIVNYNPWHRKKALA